MGGGPGLGKTRRCGCRGGLAGSSCGGIAPELVLVIDERAVRVCRGAGGGGCPRSGRCDLHGSPQPAQLPQFQLAALQGLVRTRPGDAVNLLVQAIQQGDAGLAGEAVAMINMVPGPEATKAFVGLAGSLPPARR